MTYLVIVTDALGGAEKRFLGLFAHLRRRDEHRIRLVISDRLLEKVGAVEELRAIALPEAARDVVVFESREGMPGLRRLLLRLYRTDRRAVFHYIHVPPILVQRFPSRRTVFSMTAATWKYTSRRGLVATYAGMLASGRVDVLNEPVWAGLQRAFFWRKDTITLTPNSFVDLDFYEPAPFAERTSELTFLGLFSRDKGVFRLLEVIPTLDAILRQEGVTPTYRLLGRDVEEPGIKAAAAKLDPTIEIDVHEEPNPRDILRRSKVFLSLQQTTNYPSKSLLEAYACGSLPIVTDVGDSRRIAPEALAFYVPRDFTAEDLARQTLRILTMHGAEYEARVAAGRKHLQANFSIDSMAGYYLGLYAAASAA